MSEIKELPVIEIDPTDYPHPTRGARMWFLIYKCYDGVDKEEKSKRAWELERKLDNGELSGKQIRKWQKRYRHWKRLADEIENGKIVTKFPSG